MVAGVIKFSIKLDQVQEAIEYWNSSIESAKDRSPLLKDKLRGFVVMVDRKTGNGYSIGLWNSAENSRDFEQSELFREVIGKLAKFCAKPPVREQFEVAGGDLGSLKSLGKSAA